MIAKVWTAPGAQRAWPWLPMELAPGRVFIGPTGEALRARADGGLDEIHQAGFPRRGIAADPVARRTP
jgi:hypothetical protein